MKLSSQLKCMSMLNQPRSIYKKKRKTSTKYTFQFKQKEFQKDIHIYLKLNEKQMRILWIERILDWKCKKSCQFCISPTGDLKAFWSWYTWKCIEMDRMTEMPQRRWRQNVLRFCTRFSQNVALSLPLHFWANPHEIRDIFKLL